MIFRFLVIAAMTFCLVSPSLGEEVIPPDLQASIFKKIFGYDKTIQPGALKIVVVFTDGSADLKDQILRAFQNSGISATAAKADRLASAINGANVLYLTSGIQSTKQLCQKNGILSITGIPSLVESGEASVGLSVVDSKPKIVVHLKELRSEGHDLSSYLLQLARIIH
jgi:hypothetical protein